MSEVDEEPVSFNPDEMDSEVSEVEVPATPVAAQSEMSFGRSDLGQGRRQFFARGAAAGAGAEPSSESSEVMDKPVVWGTTVNAEECMDNFRRFFEEFKEPLTGRPKYPELLDSLVIASLATINIDASNLCAFDPQLYQQLVRYPQELIPIFDLTVESIISEKYSTEEFHEKFQVRVFNLTETKSVRTMDPNDISQLVAFQGMVLRSSSIIPDLKSAYFECAMCAMGLQVEIDNGRINEPTACPNPGCAKKHTMAVVHNRCMFTDKQLVKVQESPENIPDGETPMSMDVFMFDQLVDVAKPGDRVTITGIYQAVPIRPNPRHRTVDSVFRPFIDCIHVQKSSQGRVGAEDAAVEFRETEWGTTFEESDESKEVRQRVEQKLRALAEDDDIVHRMVRSLAPSIWEMEAIKKGLLCLLFGGSNKKLKSGASYRGEINALLVGDPGTAKSQLLQFVHKIAPRGIYTSGKGSSAVGLTAYVTKDPETREMVLESGALVLSDRGVCCIDEFDKMSDSARSILHEVMEQQTVSIAKAGIICQLNARTSVLAAANPVDSRYNRNMSIVQNIQLPPTLISRFDLIYLVLDKPDARTDRHLASHLVNLYMRESEQNHQTGLIDLDTLTQYISFARKHIHPKLTDDAVDQLVDCYVDMRAKGQQGNRHTITATPRQLEGMIRLSESLAKMRLCKEVTRHHVVEARSLMDNALASSATDPRTGRVDMDTLTTGESSNDRHMREEGAEKLRRMFTDQSVQSMRKYQLLDKFKVYADMEDLRPYEFDKVLEVLQREDVIRVSSNEDNPVITLV